MSAEPWHSQAKSKIVKCKKEIASLDCIKVIRNEGFCHHSGIFKALQMGNGLKL